MASRKNLTDDFVIELFKLCMKDKRVLDTAISHLKFQFLPSDAHKQVWKQIQDYYTATNKVLTIGLLSQHFEHDLKVIGVIAAIKNARMPGIDAVFEELEIFIKNKMFIRAYDELGELFNKNKKDEAYTMVEKIGSELTNFSIKDRYYDKIFAGHKERISQRRAEADEDDGGKVKVPFTIPEIDDITRGGGDKGDTVLISAQSGVGKTKLLRHIGVGAARRGFKVAHIQAEGSRKECLDGYDATFTGVRLYDIERGIIGDQETVEKIDQTINYVTTTQGGEIYVEAFEQFNTASLLDVRNMLQDLIKTHGELDLVLLDYFDLFLPGDGRKYGPDHERQKREAVANKIKNLALEFNVLIVTCTQASTVDTASLNDPNFVQTRFHISEFKGAVKPFSYFFTLNQTRDEKKAGKMRIFLDKVRKYSGQQIVHIYQRYDYEKFCDVKRTLAELYQRDAA